MKIMGIDQSLTGTGLCILEEGKIVLSRLIASKKKGVERIIEIKNEIIKTINEFAPDYIAIEKYNFSPRRAMAFELGELAGVIKVTLAELGKKFIVIHTGHIKRYATGRGNAEKALVLLHVYKKFGVEFNNDNLADAYVIAKILESSILAKEGKKKKKDFEKNEWDVIKEYVK